MKVTSTLSLIILALLTTGVTNRLQRSTITKPIQKAVIVKPATNIVQKVAITKATQISTVTILWDYPTGKITNGMAFQLCSTTNIILPLLQWPQYGEWAATNLISQTNQQLITYQVTIPAEGYRFFVCRAKNKAGIYSDFATTSLPYIIQMDLIPSF